LLHLRTQLLELFARNSYRAERGGAAPVCSDMDLLADLKGVVGLDMEVANGAF
jgi:hypothetical protein